MLGNIRSRHWNLPPAAGRNPDRPAYCAVDRRRSRRTNRGLLCRRPRTAGRWVAEDHAAWRAAKRKSRYAVLGWPHRDKFPEPLVFPVRRGFIFHGKGVVMHILEQSENTVIGKVARGSSAKRASALMNYGNLIAILVPFPLLIFWFGASMLVYAMNRHHPNPKVGYYTQQAAYRFYGVTGFFIVIATFIPGSGWIWHL
ncbi:MAG TPA: hypothetical protein PKA43_08375, partial [Candidatus Competibacter phosphatis]|nr:hypothetical protein [Candidatus Competibacter phosphatis]